MKEQKRIQTENNMHNIEDGKIIDLSKEILSISDYKWLAAIIQKSSYMESIILPEIHDEDAELILCLLNEATIRNSTLLSLDFKLSFSNKEIPENILTLRQQIESRLIRNSNRVFGIHGGGNIGLGLMADVVAKSPFKYQITATSNNQLTHTIINSLNKVWLHHDDASCNGPTCITNVKMISRKKHDIIKLYTEASLAAICVTPSVLPEIADDIAQALIARFAIDGSGLKILILMNLPNCAKFVHDKVYDQMLAIMDDQKQVEKIMACSEFVPTVIDRIVTTIDILNIKEQLKSQLLKLNEDYIVDDLLMNHEELSRVVTTLDLQITLFNAEKKFTVYAPEHIPEIYRLPHIRITKNLSQLEAVKNKYINGPHAILAWIGALFGCPTIAESIKHPAIHIFVKTMMENEIGPILMAEYPAISRKDLEFLEADFFDRCLSSTNDSVTRVGRDPLRKLDSGGRIRGTLELAKKHHLKLSTTGLEQGMAAGVLYAIKGMDPSNPGCKKILEIYERTNDSFAEVLCYNGSAPNETFTGLDPKKDGKLIHSILTKITFINNWYEKMYIGQRQQSTTTIIKNELFNNSLKSSINNITAANQFFNYFPKISRIMRIDNTSTLNMIKMHYNRHYLWHNNSKNAHKPFVNVPATRQLKLFTK